MIFSYCRIDSLPRLAWCAEIIRGEQLVSVYHGADVEIDPAAFFEGAWNGPYLEKEFDKAGLFCGSGARLGPDKVVFVTDTAIFDWLYSVRVGERLFVSNSLAFLFATTDDQPDPAYPFYYYDLINYARLGLRCENRVLHSERGRDIRLHWVCNLEVDTALALRETPKTAGPEPLTYQGYVGRLASTLEQLAANAAHPARGLRYRPLSGLSSGYDVNACAALASRLGYREAFTFQSAEPGDLRHHPREDSGYQVGRKLGMCVNRVGVSAYQHLPIPRDHEFCANPAGSEVRLAGLEQELAGRLLVGGRMGDRMWTTDPNRVEPDYMQPDSTHISGLSANDFRLRLGYLRVDLPQLDWQHPRAIHRISVSEDLRPWRLGGNYDRPIPRRILEESGVPRELFGHRKIAGAFVPLPFNPNYLSADAAADYDQYYAAMSRFAPMNLLQRVRAATPVLARQVATALQMNPHSKTRGALRATLIIGRRAMRAELIKGLYTFHWGVERVKPRYRIPESAISSHRLGLVQQEQKGRAHNA